MNIADKKVDKIAWTRYQGKLYGVAHNKAGEPLGNVRVENGDKRYRIVAQNFIDDSYSAKMLPWSTGGASLKQEAISTLVDLLVD